MEFSHSLPSILSMKTYIKLKGKQEKVNSLKIKKISENRHTKKKNKQKKKKKINKLDLLQ